MCQGNRWLPANRTDQRFAAIVSLWQDYANIDIYTRLRQQALVFQRVRVQVQCMAKPVHLAMLSVEWASCTLEG